MPKTLRIMIILAWTAVAVCCSNKKSNEPSQPAAENQPIACPAIYVFPMTLTLTFPATLNESDITVLIGGNEVNLEVNDKQTSNYSYFERGSGKRSDTPDFTYLVEILVKNNVILTDKVKVSYTDGPCSDLITETRTYVITQDQIDAKSPL